MCASADRSVVLYVASDSIDTDSTVRALQASADLDVTTARSQSNGLSTLSTRPVDCVISEYDLPDGNGISFCEQVRAEFGTVPFVLCAADGSEAIAVRAFRSGVTDYLSKDNTEQETLCDRVCAAIEASTEAEELTPRNGGIRAGTTRFDLGLDDTNTVIRELDLGSQELTGDEWAGQAVDETKESDQRIVQLSADYLVVVDESGTITDVTSSIERIVGYSREKIIGTNVFDYVHPDDEDRFYELFDDVISNPETEIDVEYRSRTQDGSYRWTEARSNNPLDGSLSEGIALTVRDISERKKHEQKLANTTAQLQRKNEQFERLAQIVSHDLQTPMSTAEKITQLLRADLGEPEPSVEQLLTDLEATHDRLQEFAKQLPRLARESTDVDRTTVCKLQDIAEATWQVVETGSLELQIESNRSLRANPERLQRVFENLFQNTVTHAVEGVDHNGAESSNNATTVCVGTFDGGFYIADDGPGIGPEQQEQVFEYGMSTGSGTGFGLAIVRTVVEAHGWTVDVGDCATGGARFEITTEDEY